MKSFNVNDFVLVKITPTGEQAWKAYYKAHGLRVPAIHRNAKGYTRLQVWQVMEMFGNLFFLGCAETPIEMNILIP